jgi:hypothetical protein
LAGAEGRADAWGTAFGAVVVVVVGDDVGKGADLGVFKLGQVFRDVVVEVNLDVGIFGFVGVASGGAVIPER